MTDDIQKLISSLRLGEYEDPTEKISLLSAALVERNADLDLLVSLLRAPQIPLRLAAMDASRDRNEEAILSELTAFAAHPEPRIRLKLAEILASRSDQASGDALRKLADDTEGFVRVAVLKSTVGRPEFREFQEESLLQDADWSVRHAAVVALNEQRSPEVVKAFASALQTDDDNDLRRRCTEIIERWLREFPEETERHLPG